MEKSPTLFCQKKAGDAMIKSCDGGARSMQIRWLEVVEVEVVAGGYCNAAIVLLSYRGTRRTGLQLAHCSLYHRQDGLIELKNKTAV